MSTSLVPQDDIWESTSSFQVVEEANEVDGIHILAKVRGPAFFPETTSRNNVFYPKEAWVNAINDSEFQQRLNDRLIYGTIGHGIKLDDAAIRDGKFSHIVTNVVIDESGVGIAEYLVLNTPPGQILNTILRAGSKIRVSTKAKGLFESNKSKGGAKVINPKMFKFERIDFVLDPGYLQAHPDLLESFNQFNNEENLMDPNNNKVVEILESRIEELKQEKGVTAATAAELTTKVQSIGEALSQANSTVSTYAAFGTPEEVKESLSLLSKYKELGECDKISEALDKADQTIDHLNEILESHAGQISESLKMDEVTEELKKYRELGTVDELTTVIESAEKLADKMLASKVIELAKTHSVNESVINKFMKKGIEIQVIEEMLASFKPVNEENEEYELDDEGNPKLDADGNKIPKKKEETSESKKKVAKKVNEEQEYELDDNGEPKLDSDGNPIPKKKDISEASTRRFSKINESKSNKEPTRAGKVNGLAAKLLAGTR